MQDLESLVTTGNWIQIVAIALIFFGGVLQISKFVIDKKIKTVNEILAKEAQEAQEEKVSRLELKLKTQSKPENIEKNEIINFLNTITENPEGGYVYFNKILKHSLTKEQGLIVIDACEKIMKSKNWQESQSIHLLLNFLIKDNPHFAFENNKLIGLLKLYFRDKEDNSENFKVYQKLIHFSVTNYIKSQNKETEKNLTRTIGYPLEKTSRHLSVAQLKLNTSQTKILNKFFDNISKNNNNETESMIDNEDLEFFLKIFK